MCLRHRRGRLFAQRTRLGAVRTWSLAVVGLEATAPLEETIPPSVGDAVLHTLCPAPFLLGFLLFILGEYDAIGMHPKPLP